MSTLSQFVGGAVTTSIVNAHSGGGTATTIAIQGSVNNGMKEELSGAMTASTLKTILSVTGAGRVPQLSAYTKDATSRTVRLVVVVDGATVFDATSSAITNSSAGIFAAGYADSAGLLFPGEPIVFTSSLLVQLAFVRTDLTASETDKLAIGYTVYRN